MPAADMFPAPVDAAFYYIKTIVGAFFAQVACERNSHTANAAAHIQHVVAWLQPAKIFKEAKEFFTLLHVVPVSDKNQPAWWNTIRPAVKQEVKRIGRQEP